MAANRNTIRIPADKTEAFAEVIMNLEQRGLAYTANLSGEYYEIEITGH